MEANLFRDNNEINENAVYISDNIDHIFDDFFVDDVDDNNTAKDVVDAVNNAVKDVEEEEDDDDGVKVVITTEEECNSDFQNLIYNQQAYQQQQQQQAYWANYYNRQAYCHQQQANYYNYCQQAAYCQQQQQANYYNNYYYQQAYCHQQQANNYYNNYYHQQAYCHQQQANNYYNQQQQTQTCNQQVNNEQQNKYNQNMLRPMDEHNIYESDGKTNGELFTFSIENRKDNKYLYDIFVIPKVYKEIIEKCWNQTNSSKITDKNSCRKKLRIYGKLLPLLEKDFGCGDANQKANDEKTELKKVGRHRIKDPKTNTKSQRKYTKKLKEQFDKCYAILRKLSCYECHGLEEKQEMFFDYDQKRLKIAPKCSM